MTTSNDDRAARLKAALRDNLRRRKVQARGRTEESGQADTGSPQFPERETNPPPNRER